MRDNLFILGRELSAFFISGLVLVFVLAMVYIDVNWMHDAMKENSFTELTQEIMLAVTAGLFFCASRQRPALVLVGGFFSCMLIRELDFLFDMIKHGCWVWFALAATVISLGLALRQSKAIVPGLVSLVEHRSWQMMAAGLLTVLVFSRLFGMHQLWEHLMLDGYNRVVKNMAEEGSELLGYSFCLIASVRYVWQTRPQAIKARAVARLDSHSEPAQPHIVPH